MNSGRDGATQPQSHAAETRDQLPLAQRKFQRALQGRVRSRSEQSTSKICSQVQALLLEARPQNCPELTPKLRRVIPPKVITHVCYQVVSFMSSKSSISTFPFLLSFFKNIIGGFQNG